MLGIALKRLFIAAQIVLSSRLIALSEIRQPQDFFVMQALHNANVSDDVLMSPKLRGIHLRDRWQVVQPTPEIYSFAWLDEQINRAKSFNKQVTLGIYTGRNSPSWLSVPLVDGVPVPWDPQVTAAHNLMVSRLGAQYANEPAVVAVHISGPATNNSLEMHYPMGLTSVIGYSDERIIETWKVAIDAYAAAFPNNVLVLDVAMVPNSGGAVTTAVIDYARSVLGERANFIHASLKASTNVNAPHHATLVGLALDGARIGFEMVSPSIDTERFGGPFSEALKIGEQAQAKWYQIYQADVPLIPDYQLGLLGDYNENGQVDVADYVLWHDNDGSPDGYNTWRAHFGQTDGSDTGDGETTVPEPAAFVILFTGMLAMLYREFYLCHNLARFLGWAIIPPISGQSSSATFRQTTRIIERTVQSGGRLSSTFG